MMHGCRQCDYDVCTSCKPIAWRQGNYAKVGKDGKVGKLTMNPDSDNEVELLYADGTKSSYTNVSRLIEATEADYDVDTTAPPYWSAAAQQSCASGNPQHKAFAETKAMFSPCRSIVNDTFLAMTTRDRQRANPLPDRLKVVDVLRNENAPLWAQFASKRSEIQDEIHTWGLAVNGVPGPGNSVPKTMQSMDRKYLSSLSADVNEFYLFHGTSPSGVDGIFRNGFQISLAGSGAGTAFGNGAYFSECSSKSDEYAKEDTNHVMMKGRFALLLCRVVCGNMRHVTSFDTSAHTKTKAPEHHSLLGDREAAVGTYREFIVYDSAQIYPEFAIIYKRDFS
jgi:hypothetical protein